MQPNDLGMDEYMELTRIIGVEPYVTVNAGLGDANSAAEEVEYLNGAPEQRMGRQARRQRTQPRHMASSSGTSATNPTAGGRSARPRLSTS